VQLLQRSKLVEHQGLISVLTVLCIIRGNVDDSASVEDLPEVQVLSVNGWRLLMTHICGMPPKGGAFHSASMPCQSHHGRN
jgi:predicted phosphodiesterase